MNKKYVLLKDLVIPAGTCFVVAPESRSYGEGHYEATIGLSKDSYGTMTYSIGGQEAELKEYFTELK